MSKKSKSFGTQHAAKPHLVAGGGGLSGEVVDLRNDVETGFQAGEARTGFPELDWIDGGAIAAAGATAVLKGRNLLQGQTFDSLVTGSGNAEVTYTAMKPGNSPLRVKVVQGAGALSTVLAADLLTVTLAAAGSTATAVATAVNAAASCKGIIRAVKGGTGGSNVAVLDETPLSGGAGLWTGNKVLVSGVEAMPLHATGSAPAATWADDEISVTVPDLTAETPARAVGDIVGTTVQSDGVTSQQLSCALA